MQWRLMPRHKWGGLLVLLVHAMLWRCVGGGYVGAPGAGQAAVLASACGTCEGRTANSSCFLKVQRAQCT